MLIAQITDCHVTAPGHLMADRVDPTVGLQRAVDHLVGLGDELDLVLATGDLVNDGRAAEYDRLHELLAPLTAPVVVVPGNHDDRTELRARFPELPAGDTETPIDRIVELDDVRLVCLDTNLPGHHHGHLRPGQLAWLDTALSARSDTPTIVVQHHPPFASGIASMDRYGLTGADEELEIVARHRHVVAVLGGHYHRTILRSIGDTTAFACPSTAVQLLGRLGPGPTTYCSDPPALALHHLVDGGLTTHVVQLHDVDDWIPSWAN